MDVETSGLLSLWRRRDWLLSQCFLVAHGSRRRWIYLVGNAVFWIPWSTGVENGARG